MLFCLWRVQLVKLWIYLLIDEGSSGCREVFCNRVFGFEIVVDFVFRCACDEIFD